MEFNNTLFKLGLITLLIVVVVESFADMFNWYYIFPNLDTPMHILGGMLVGFFALAYTPRHANAIGKLIWVIAWTLLIGGLLEIVEWMLDSKGNIGVVLQDSNLDTFTDMLHDFAGGVIAYCVGYFTKRIN
jgi:hypothetical protein